MAEWSHMSKVTGDLILCTTIVVFIVTKETYKERLVATAQPTADYTPISLYTDRLMMPLHNIWSECI
ncbi:hypothetical protein XELAEV_18009312mg [Xenopus laevis]|uniref:Uncharacterized protein n=1 Tax=Xenopus laevis TaxID=8355 RepID=A0A974DS80_XENLA|nr:hypothetical protein XELAEV_18009312mg [Xenopus laevis]